MTRWMGVLVLWLVASACGAGGGGGGDAGTEVACSASNPCPAGQVCTSAGVCTTTSAADQTPPGLASYAPQDATKVLVGTPLRFTFDEPVVVKPDGVQALDAEAFTPVAATYSVSVDGLTLTVMPVVTTPLRLAISFPGVVDGAGNVTRDQPPEFSFPVFLGYVSPQEDRTTDVDTAEIALDVQERPVLAWCEGTVSPKLYVDRFDGPLWSSLGGGVVNVDPAGSVTSHGPALAARGEHLVLAWEEFVPPDLYTFHVRRWTGTAWEALPGALPVSRLSSRPHLALHADGAPVLALNSGNAVQVYAHDGAAWQELGSLAEGDVQQLDLAFALGADDVPYVLYNRYDPATGTTTPRVRRWNAAASTWDAFDGSPHRSRAGLTVDSGGRPWVTYKASAAEMVVSHWTGSGWSTPERLNGTIHTGGDIWEPRMATEPDGTLVSVWIDNDYELWIARNSGAGWQVVPRAVNPARNSAWTRSFTFAAGATGPWVAFTDRFDVDLYVSRVNR